MIICFILTTKQLIFSGNVRRIYTLINWLRLKGLMVWLIEPEGIMSCFETSDIVYWHYWYVHLIRWFGSFDVLFEDVA